jgi:hypothetical protein
MFPFVFFLRCFPAKPIELNHLVNKVMNTTPGILSAAEQLSRK